MDDVEHDKDDGACRNADGKRDEGITHVLAPVEGRLEADTVGKADENRQGEDDQEGHAVAVHEEAEPPELHRHQHRHGEDEGPGEGARQADEELATPAMPDEGGHAQEPPRFATGTP